jgi:homoserine O-acetyltransferase
MAVSAVSTAQQIAFNDVGRRAIQLDPGWKGGDYYPGDGPSEGLSIARTIGIITYKSDQIWNERFGRRVRLNGDQYRWDSQFSIQSYLSYQGEKLERRFDANSYLYLLRAMDLHNIGHGYSPTGSWEEVLERVKAGILVVGISSDLLYPPYQQHELVCVLHRLRKKVSYYELESPYGHDAFLIEFEKIGLKVRDFLGSI